MEDRSRQRRRVQRGISCSHWRCRHGDDGHRSRRPNPWWPWIHPGASRGNVDEEWSRIRNVYWLSDCLKRRRDQMPIEFEPPKPITQAQFMLKTVGEEMIRPKSRYFDEHEHEIPWDYIEFMHAAMKAMGGSSLAPRENGKEKEGQEKRPPLGYQLIAAQIESLTWGDLGFYHCLPGGGLGAAAVFAAGTPEQKAKFLARFNEEKPTFAAMCITEAGAGSDNSAIRTRAVLDEKANEWILNGEKIFVTGGDKSFTEYEKLGKGYIVVWATIDTSAGRAGMRAFVVEGGTPGVKITKLEHKMGIRVSDTAAISLVDVRLPFDHILGSPMVEKTTLG